MGRLTMVRPHRTDDLEIAKQRVREVLRDMKPTLDKYVQRIDWNDDGTLAHVKGKHVSGTFLVDTMNLKVDLKLSLTATLIKRKIQSRIDEAVSRNFGTT